MSTVAAPPVFKTKLIGREEIANQTMAFRFEKMPGWTYTAGQAIDITLIDPPESDSEGNTRGLSLASAPFEDTIMVATRLRDTAFKRVLKLAPLGTEVKIEGPFGNLRCTTTLRGRPSSFVAVLESLPFAASSFRRPKRSCRIDSFSSSPTTRDRMRRSSMNSTVCRQETKTTGSFLR